MCVCVCVCVVVILYWRDTKGERKKAATLAGAQEKGCACAHIRPHCVCAHIMSHKICVSTHKIIYIHIYIYIYIYTSHVYIMYIHSCVCVHTQNHTRSHRDEKLCRASSAAASVASCRTIPLGASIEKRSLPVLPAKIEARGAVRATGSRGRGP